MRNPYMARGQDPAGWVTETFPGPLRRALEQHGGVPHTVRAVVARQLPLRTAEQLRERIERRWYERYAHLPGQELLDRADEIAVELVREPGCEISNRCEDGWLLDEEAICAWCQPSGTVFDVREPDLAGGRRSSPETVSRMAAEIRASMRAGRRYRPQRP
ncbi:hypothetical protein [Kitasatospora camelliae]|uniref:Uncharacterized protein n=1 Tax=Kitasatospora camelliae TaxID=3156397 RepID=A0AAU8K4Q1_9ACTN